MPNSGMYPVDFNSLALASNSLTLSPISLSLDKNSYKNNKESKHFCKYTYKQKTFLLVPEKESFYFPFIYEVEKPFLNNVQHSILVMHSWTV